MKLKKKSSPLKLLSQSQPNFAEQDGTAGHNFEREPPKDHSDKAWLKLA
jgi:hypothetical protein